MIMDKNLKDLSHDDCLFWCGNGAEYMLRVTALNGVENPLDAEEWPGVLVDIGARKFRYLFQGLDEAETVNPELGSMLPGLARRFVSGKEISGTVARTENADYAVFPIWGYRHGGMSFSCGKRVYPYTDEYDSGFVGTLAVRMTAEDGMTERKTAEAVIKRLNTWLDGHVYTYEIRKRMDTGSWELVCEDNGEYWGMDAAENGLFESVGNLSLGFAEAMEAGAVSTGRAVPRQITVYDFERTK